MRAIWPGLCLLLLPLTVMTNTGMAVADTSTGGLPQPARAKASIEASNAAVVLCVFTWLFLRLR